MKRRTSVPATYGFFGFKMKSAVNHPAIEQLYGQIHIFVRQPGDLRRPKPYDRSRLIGEPTRFQSHDSPPFR